VAVHRGLLECDFGDWTGRELKELFKLPEWTTVQRYPSGFRFPNGESFAEMQLRIVWEEILARKFEIEVLAEPERVLSTFIKGYLSMPVRTRN